MFSLWIQRADLQTRHWAVATVSDAVAALESHDWPAELRHRDELVARGAELCPPGLGLEDEERRMLHICPLDAELADVHYHHQVWHRLLGLLPVAKDVISTVQRVPLREIPSLMERFCSGQHAWLERRFSSGPAGRS